MIPARDEQGLEEEKDHDHADDHHHEEEEDYRTQAVDPRGLPWWVGVGVCLFIER